MRRDALTLEIQRRRPLAMQIARAFTKYLPRSVTRDDVEQAAMIGLWKALKKPRDPGVDDRNHEWFIKCRIRGAILDELRLQNWLPRRTRTGAHGEPLEVVHFEDIRSKYHWQDRYGSGEPTVDEAIDIDKEAAEAMRAPLQPKDRKVIELIIFGGIRQTDVADELGVSEARISQRYATALDLMHRHLTGGEMRPPNLKNQPRRRKP